MLFDLRTTVTRQLMMLQIEPAEEEEAEDDDRGSRSRGRDDDRGGDDRGLWRGGKKAADRDARR